MMVSRITPAPSATGLVSTLVAAPPGPWLRASLDVSDQVKATSSESGFGRVTIETMTATITPTTNAALAPTKLPAWLDRDSTPVRTRTSTITAAIVPDTSPVQPAVPVIRFQNRPRMKIANNGALKKLNSDWM